MTLASLRGLWVATLTALRSGMRWPLCGWVCTKGKVLEETGREERARTNQCSSWTTFVMHRGFPWCFYIPYPPHRAGLNVTCSLPLNLTCPFLLPVYTNFPKTDLARRTLRYTVSRPQSSHRTQYLCDSRDDDNDVIKLQRGPASTTRLNLAAV